MPSNQENIKDDKKNIIVDGKNNESKADSNENNAIFSMNKMTDGSRLMVKKEMGTSGKWFQINNCKITINNFSNNVTNHGMKANNISKTENNCKLFVQVGSDGKELMFKANDLDEEMKLANIEIRCNSGTKGKLNSTIQNKSKCFTNKRMKFQPLMKRNVNSVNKLCEILSHKSILLVIEQFPNKIKEIERLKKEFDWQTIDTLQTDVAWMEWFVNSIKTRDQNYIKMFNMDKTIGCIIQNGSKPKICHAYVFFQELGHKSDIDRNLNFNLIDTNPLVHNLSKRLKGYLIELHTIALNLSIGLELSIPKIQEGNNFGVEVIQKANRIAIDIYNISLTHLSLLDEYYCERAQTLSKMIRHVYIEDYRIVLNRLDRENYYVLCCIVNHMYQNYSLLYDFIIKNLNKLLNPRD